MVDGLCRASGEPDAWFPEKGQTSQLARRICDLCPVKDPCLDWGVYHNEGYGVWGGKTPVELEAIRDRLGVLDR